MMHPHYGFVGSSYVSNNVGIKQVQQIYGNSIHHQQVPFYSQHSNYSNIHQKINIICREHGKFLQTPSNHMMGKGCPKCNQIIQNDLNPWLPVVTLPNPYVRVLTQVLED